MPIHHVNIDRILDEKSRFTLRDRIFEKDLNELHLLRSLEDLGILNPVILYEDSRGTLHLINGRKRIQYAARKKLRSVDAVILPPATPPSDIVTLLFYEKKHEIYKSVMNKIQFICYAMLFEIPEPWLFKTLCIPMDFRPHSKFLRDCQRINTLPQKVKIFLHEKRLSFKQIVNLTYHPEELLLRLIALRSELHLSVSILDEIASNLKDHLRAQHKTVDDFFSAPEVTDILSSTLNCRDKTEMLRQHIMLKRYPVLSKVNAGIQRAVDVLNLPNEILITWDKTLENKNIDVTLRIDKAKKWTEVLEKLKSAEMRRTIGTLLDKL